MPCMSLILSIHLSTLIAVHCPVDGKLQHAAQRLEHSVRGRRTEVRRRVEERAVEESGVRSVAEGNRDCCTSYKGSART